MLFECSGSEKIKRPVPESVKCPSCSEELEIWSDEVEAKCQACGAVYRRQLLQTCLDWCKFAQDCLGKARFNTYSKNKTILLKEKLLEALEEYFGTDTKRINHAKKVLAFSEELLAKEGGDWNIVVAASILHDVGIKPAEEKYNSSAGHWQEKLGPQIARQILQPYGVKKEDIEQICQIIGHHHSPGALSTKNFAIVCDADWLVNLNEEVDTKDKKKVEAIIEKVFVTKAAKEMAKKLYL